MYPARLTKTNPIWHDNNQRDEVLASALKALQIKQIKDLPMVDHIFTVNMRDQPGTTISANIVKSVVLL